MKTAPLLLLNVLWVPGACYGGSTTGSPPGQQGSDGGTSGGPADASEDQGSESEPELGEPALHSPEPGSTLTGTQVTFDWTDGGSAERVYDLLVGSTLGGSDYLETEGLGTTSEAIADGLPRDGSLVHVRLHWSDDDGDSTSYADYTFTAVTDGAQPVCGNGALEPTEQCDDRNLNDGDGCSSSCLDEPMEGEFGGASPTSECGNGVREPTEQCDDGNTIDGDGCSSQCSIITEPVAGAFYVTTAGDDGNDGLSEASAFRTMQHGIDQLVAGDTLYVKAGNYGAERITVNESGQADAPIVIEGYQYTPGDNPRIVNYDHTSSPDASVTPLLDGGDRANNMGFRVNSDHVWVKNLQVTHYEFGVYLYGSNSVIDNVIASKFGSLADDYSGGGFWLEGQNHTLRNSVMLDAGGQGVTLQDSGHRVEYSKIYGTSDADANGMDYYLILGGGPDRPCSDNTIQHNYMERVGDVEHIGHGFSVKGTGENNLFQHCTAVNMMGSGFVARHQGVAFNTYTHNTVDGGTGLLIREGAHDNLFEDITVRDTIYGVGFLPSLEDETNTDLLGSTNNTLRDLRFEGVTSSIFYFVGNYEPEGISSGNVLENMSSTGATPYLLRGDHHTDNNVIRDSTFDGVQELAVSYQHDIEDIDVLFENSVCTNCGFVLP